MTMDGRCPETIVRLTSTLATVFVLAFVPSARAGDWNGSCDVRFRGSSTLHDFTGTVRCEPFQVGIDDTAKGTAIIPGAEVAVLAGAMDTANKTRDRQMREMFQSDKYPRIRGIFGTLDPGRIRKELHAGPGGSAPLEFTLRIRDIEHPVRAVLSNFRESDDVISFDVEYAVSLKDYQLVPPKAFFGIVRVDDRIAVKTTVRLEAARAR